MCSIDDDELKFTESRTDGSTGDIKQCTRCREGALIVLRSDDALCQECFLARATHKFRAEFGKSRLFADKEDVLVAFSGGSCSCAVLHLIQEGLSQKAMKKLRFRPVLVFLDESLSNSKETDIEQQSITRQVITLLLQSQLRYYVYALEQIFDEELHPLLSSSEDHVAGDVDKLLSNQRPGTDSLVSLLQSAGSLTAREALVSMLRRRLLVRAAQKYGKLIVGETSVDLAVRLISQVTQGHGAHVANEMGFADSRDEGVTILRPMRDFQDIEVDLYNKLNNIQPVTRSSRSLRLDSNTGAQSIDSLSREFVLSLQEEHANTLSIICRTGQKLVETPNDSLSIDEFICSLCAGTLDTDSSAMKASSLSQSLCQRLRDMNAAHGTSSDLGKTSVTTIDRNVSISTGNNVVAADFTNLCCSGDYTTVNGVCDGREKGLCCRSVASGRNLLTMAELKKNLCYGCRLVIKNLDDVHKFPPFVIEQAVRQNQRREMRRTISDCLLVDDR